MLPLAAKMKMTDSDYGHKDGVCMHDWHATFYLMASARDASHNDTKTIQLKLAIVGSAWPPLGTVFPRACA